MSDLIAPIAVIRAEQLFLQLGRGRRGSTLQETFFATELKPDFKILSLKSVNLLWFCFQDIIIIYFVDCLWEFYPVITVLKISNWSYLTPRILWQKLSSILLGNFQVLKEKEKTCQKVRENFFSAFFASYFDYYYHYIQNKIYLNQECTWIYIRSLNIYMSSEHVYFT